MLRLSWMIRSTLTPAPSSISYRVTVGPRVKPDTRQSTPNSVNTCVSAAITSSLARVCSRCALPLANVSSDGSR